MDPTKLDGTFLRDVAIALGIITGFLVAAMQFKRWFSTQVRDDMMRDAAFEAFLKRIVLEAMHESREEDRRDRESIMRQLISLQNHLNILEERIRIGKKNDSGPSAHKEP